METRLSASPSPCITAQGATRPASPGRPVFENEYEIELSSLRELGREFAQKHPAIAGMLAERGDDPDVEQLLEGFAFVGSRLRRRIDAAVPDLIESMTDLLLPHFLRPTPASTIVQFQAARGAHGEQRLALGTTLESSRVRGAVCPFRISRALSLSPLQLVGQQLNDAAPARPELTLRFQVEQGAATSHVGPEGLRLHLHGELPTATQLYLWFARHVSDVTLRAADGSTVELGAHAVKAVGLDDADTLFPWPAFSPHGVRLLLEFFTLLPKFLFVDVSGFDRAAHLGGSRFELVFRFARPPALPARLPDDALRLHCVPAVNLFEVAAEPVRVPLEGRPTLLRAAGIDPFQAEVFAVRSVLGMGEKGTARRCYESFHSFRHAFDAAPHRGFYQIKRERSPVDDGTHTFVQLGNCEPEGPSLDEETLSIELTCTSRSVANSLQVGDLCVPTGDTPAGVTCSNISLVTRPARPPLGPELVWPFTAHLSVTRRSLVDVEVLKSLLSLYNFQERSDHGKGRTNRARIEAIQTVSAVTIMRVFGGAAVRGTLFRVVVDQTGFASEGDAFLFGSVLHRVLGNYGEMYTFADLELVLAPTQLSFRWQMELAA